MAVELAHPRTCPAPTYAHHIACMTPIISTVTHTDKKYYQYGTPPHLPLLPRERQGQAVRPHLQRPHAPVARQVNRVDQLQGGTSWGVLVLVHLHNACSKKSQLSRRLLEWHASNNPVHNGVCAAEFECACERKKSHGSTMDGMAIQSSTNTHQVFSWVHTGQVAHPVRYPILKE